MRIIISIGILFGQMFCTAVAVASVRWILIDTSLWPAVIGSLSVIALCGLVYLRDGMLVADGYEDARHAIPVPLAQSPLRRQSALPEEVVAVLEQLMTYAEETQASAAAAVAAAKISVENMWGVDRHQKGIETENAGLRDHGARMDADLNAIAQVVQERTGPPMPSSPMRRTFDGRGSEPALDEPRIAMRPRPVDDDPVPAFLTKPRIDLSELERMVGREPIEKGH